MAAITITAASVALVSGTPTKDAVAGEAFTAGDLVYLNPTTGKWLKAQCDGTAYEAGAEDLAIALATADAANARVSLAGDGCVVGLGSVVTAGVAYCPGTTAGDLVPIADLATSTQKITVAALGVSTTDLLVKRVYHAGSVLA